MHYDLKISGARIRTYGSESECATHYTTAPHASHKNDGSTGLTSDNIINAGDECYTHVALLFTAIVVHGTVPDSFLYIVLFQSLKGNM